MIFLKNIVLIVCVPFCLFAGSSELELVNESSKESEKITLEEFKKNVLLQTESGKRLVEHYDRLEPYIQNAIKQNPDINEAVQESLLVTARLLGMLDWDNPEVKESFQEAIDWTDQTITPYLDVEPKKNEED